MEGRGAGEGGTQPRGGWVKAEGLHHSAPPALRLWGESDPSPPSCGGGQHPSAPGRVGAQEVRGRPLKSHRGRFQPPDITAHPQQEISDSQGSRPLPLRRTEAPAELRLFAVLGVQMEEIPGVCSPRVGATALCVCPRASVSGDDRLALLRSRLSSSAPGFVSGTSCRVCVRVPQGSHCTLGLKENTVSMF